MRILVVEDDERLAGHIVKAMREAGHSPELATDGRRGLIAATTEPFDLIVLDRMLPGLDGLRLLQTLRGSGDTTPVLILSAIGDVDERVKGLEAGGDDYLTKPFAITELLARVAAIGRRPAIQDDAPVRIEIGSLTIDLLGHQVTRGGEAIDLTAREFRLLLYLARNEGRVVTRSMLLEAVWDYHFDPQTNIIDQHVSRLRQKIDANFDKPLIHTVRGAGYVLRADR